MARAFLPFSSKHWRRAPQMVFILLLTVCLQLLSCKTDEKPKKSSSNGTIDLNLVGQPADQMALLPADSAHFDFVFHKFIWAPFSQSPNVGLSVASGWGYMAPLIVVDGTDQYAALWFACDEKIKNFYCVYLMKNGTVIANLHAMGIHLLPPGYSGSSAYQPPMLFKNGNEILMAYQVNTRQGNSLVNLVSVDVTDPIPLTWAYKSTFINAAGTFNYLGGAMAANGTIYIAGHGSGGGNDPRLEITSTAPPYATWVPKIDVHQFVGMAQVPVYPHIQVRNNGEIQVLFALHNSLPCSENGQMFSESYKTVVAYQGTFAGGFNEIWRDSASDVTGNDGGDSCLYHNQRFPLAQFYNSTTDVVYSLIKSSDVSIIDPGDRIGSNDNLVRKFVLYANGVQVVANLETAFSSYFANPNDIWSMNGTLQSNGKFVFSAANDGIVAALPHVGLVSSADLATFSSVYLLDTAGDRPGHSVHFGLPHKNGSTAIDRAHLFFSGTVFGGINYHHRFRFYSVIAN